MILSMMPKRSYRHIKVCVVHTWSVGVIRQLGTVRVPRFANFTFTMVFVYLEPTVTVVII